jgi:hypothetical protein
MISHSLSFPSDVIPIICKSVNGGADTAEVFAGKNANTNENDRTASVKITPTIFFIITSSIFYKISIFYIGINWNIFNIKTKFNNKYSDLTSAFNKPLKLLNELKNGSSQH